MRPLGTTARIVIFALGVAAILVLMFVTGWADDKAPPGTQGRGTVTYTDTAEPR